MFYLLGYKREEICDRGTNALNFKKAKAFINEQLFSKMANYNPTGQRDSKFCDYHKLSFLKKNLDSCEEDKVEEFSIVMSKIYKWC